MASQMIFPTSAYGQLNDVYGTNVPQYTNSQGFPQGAGLQLGQFGVLFDATIVRLLKALSVFNQYDAAYVQSGNSNDYQVLQANAVNQFVVGTNDRSGSNGLTSGSIAWFTTRGNGIVNAQSSLGGGSMVVSSTQAGYVGPYTPGVANTSNGTITGNSTQQNISLENPTTSAGPYPALFR